MSNAFLNGLANSTNYGYTENGAVKHMSTRNALLDMFAMGGAYRQRSDEDVILLFSNALEWDEVYALKCLFYLRDVRGGQGERRFFRVCMRWLAKNYPDIAKRNIDLISEYGRWDDLYCFIDTPLEEDALEVIKVQLGKDLVSVQQDNTAVSLLGKWLKSCNASSRETKRLGNITRNYLSMTQKQYRKTLSILRTRINIVEKLMSQNRWDEIEFDKIPSKAGLIYKNAFARRDIIKAKYEAFAKDENTKVNASTLYPYEVVEKAVRGLNWWSNEVGLSEVDRAMINKYWDNLTDYFNGQQLNALAVVDTSGSMHGTPINVAISLGIYCAERAGGPFANHYVSFSSRPQLIRVEGVDFVDKVRRIYKTNLIENTNIEATFDLLLNTAKANNCSQDDLPQNILVISDMEFDRGTCGYISTDKSETLMEGIAKKWEAAGYKMPHLIYWNVSARTDNIAQLGNGPVSFVSGMSPSIFQTIISGKTGVDLMYEALNSERYAAIQ